MDIDFSKPKRLSEVSTPTREAAAGIHVAQPSNDEMGMLFEKVAMNSKSVALLSAVPDFCEKFVSTTATEPNLPKCLGELYSESNRDLTHEELVELCENTADELEVTESEASYLELATRKQSASLEWFNQRIRRITASTTYQVLHTNQDEPSSSLIKQICCSEHKKVTAAPLEWGRRNEDTARSKYSKQQTDTHRFFMHSSWVCH